METRDSILNGGFIFFNRRPVIMKPWDSRINFQKDEIFKVPIWIQLVNLNLKYWGEKALFKIVGQLGNPIQLDSFTREKTRMAYPRIMVEVNLD